MNDSDCLPGPRGPNGPSLGAVASDWEAGGRRIDVGDHKVWYRIETAAAPSERPPLLAIHGFPTSSYDWAPVLSTLAAERDVILVDLLGFGLSDKPDIRYGVHLGADVATAVVEDLGLVEVDLLTHDMGDSIGGEILARSLEGDLSFEIRRRVVTNGSIYLDLANLTDGQKLLLELPDAPESLAGADGGRSVLRTLRGTYGPAAVDGGELEVVIELARRDDGLSLLPRTIRYIEDRRADEERFTGAIERHPAPLAVIWGADDPIATYAMAKQLVARRLDATLTTLRGIGHFPMLEAPDQFAKAVLAHLDAP